MYDKQKSNILQRLKRNINWWGQRGDEPVFLPQSVQPVANILEIAEEQTIMEQSTNISAVGYEPMWTIPVNEYWTIKGWNAYLSAANLTMDALYVQYPLGVNRALASNSGSDPDKFTNVTSAPYARFYLQFESGLSILSSAMASSRQCEVRLPPSSVIGVHVDAWTSAAYIYAVLQVRREMYH